MALPLADDELLPEHELLSLERVEAGQMGAERRAKLCRNEEEKARLRELEIGTDRSSLPDYTPHHRPSAMLHWQKDDRSGQPRDVFVRSALLEGEND